MPTAELRVLSPTRHPPPRSLRSASHGTLGFRVLSRPADRSTWPPSRLAGTQARTLAAEGRHGNPRRVSKPSRRTQSGKARLRPRDHASSEPSPPRPHAELPSDSCFAFVGHSPTQRSRARCRELLLVLSTQPAASSHTRAVAGVVAYERHCPETTLLYRTIQEHWATFLADLEAGGGELPTFILDEFEAYLRRGILVHGFLRVRCKDCGHCRVLLRRSLKLTLGVLTETDPPRTLLSKQQEERYGICSLDWSTRTHWRNQPPLARANDEQSDHTDPNEDCDLGNRSPRGSTVLDERKGTPTSLSLRRWAAEPAHPCPRLRAALLGQYAGLWAARLCPAVCALAALRFALQNGLFPRVIRRGHDPAAAIDGHRRGRQPGDGWGGGRRADSVVGADVARDAGGVLAVR